MKDFKHVLLMVFWQISLRWDLDKFALNFISYLKCFLKKEFEAPFDNVLLHSSVELHKRKSNILLKYMSSVLQRMFDIE